MSKVNDITICRDKYKTREDFENAIKSAVMLLLDAEYVMTVRYDEKGLGIVVIEYSPADREFGCPYPYWLDPMKEDVTELVTYEEDKCELTTLTEDERKLLYNDNE